MFHGIPVVKMLHVTYFHLAIERVKHFKNQFTPYRARKMCLQALIKEKDPWSYESLPTGCRESLPVV